MTPEMQAALNEPQIRPVTFVHVDWPGVNGGADQPWYFHSHTGDITWGGNTWQGVGRFAGISFPSMTATVIQQKASLHVLFPVAEGLQQLEQPVRNRACNVYWGLLDLETKALIPDPIPRLLGRIDRAKFSYGKVGDDGSVAAVFTVEVVTGVPIRRFGTLTHSHEDQIGKYPGDTAGKRLWNIATKAFEWG